jgi:hypothetical protein
LAVALADAERGVGSLALLDALRIPVQQPAPDDAHLGLPLTDHHPAGQNSRQAGSQRALDLVELTGHLPHHGDAGLGTDNRDVPGLERFDSHRRVGGHEHLAVSLDRALLEVPQ